MNKMNKMNKTFYLFLSVFTVMVTNCQKETLEPVLELPIDSEQKVLTVEKNGVAIEFCLLNEQGEPATIFNEGENFKFHLAIINNVEPDTAMYIVSDFLRNSGLFTVFNNRGNKIGKPINWYIMDLRSDAANEIAYNNKWDMKIPWHETRGTEEPFNIENLIIVFQHYFIGLNQQPLSKGKYYTKLNQGFCLGRYYDSKDFNEVPFVCTDTLIFKINFEIK